MLKLFLLLIFVVSVNANSFSLFQGEVRAHTEVFGDSTINPKSTKINSLLLMPKGVESLKGSISFDALSLVSDNLDRDEHMYEALNVKNHTFISFQIKSVQKQGTEYLLKGKLTLNGTQKDIESLVSVVQKEGTLELAGTFSIMMSDFNIEPPTLLFLTVRDQVDIEYTLNYKEERESNEKNNFSTTASNITVFK